MLNEPHSSVLSLFTFINEQSPLQPYYLPFARNVVAIMSLYQNHTPLTVFNNLRVVCLAVLSVWHKFPRLLKRKNSIGSCQ